ncbi:MAG: sulfatase [Chitinophagaceae bacterium]|nr:MAG: sulfatase [Chitinophagaceae bacterium]
MFSKAWFIIRYWLGWVLFFQIGRLLFIAANLTAASKAGWSNIFGAAYWGARMDMSMATYLTLPVCLLVLLSIFIPSLRSPRIYKWYTIILLFPILVITGADIGLFREWGFRIDSSFLKYLSNPSEAWASVSHLPVWLIIPAFIACFVLLSMAAGRWTKYLSNSLASEKKKWVAVVSVVLLIGISVIPLRGGFQLAPLNQSSVYFSSDNFANLSALNASWNFMHSLSHKQGNKNPFVFMEPEQAQLLVDSLNAKNLNAKPGLQTKPNVIVIVWESFTSKVIDLKYNGVEVTPGFNKLKGEGIYFSNIYATGDRTDKGIVGILSGYPAQPTTSIVKTPAKAGSLPMLGKDFKNAGYQTSFYYGGELEFANMKAYLSGGGYDRFISVNDFSAADKNSKWGAHDGVVKDRLLKDLTSARQPFFYNWLTLSSHEPFETPDPTVIAGKAITEMFLNSLHYTDKVLTDFIETSKKQPWWANTVIVIVADHGHPYPVASNKPQNFKIPLLFLGGGVKQAVINDKAGSQTDLAATLLTQVGFSNKAYPYSVDLMDSIAVPRAYFAFNNGFGFVNKTGFYVFDNVGQRPNEVVGSDSTAMRLAGQAMEQVSFGDYLKR